MAIASAAVSQRKGWARSSAAAIQRSASVCHPGADAIRSAARASPSRAMVGTQAVRGQHQHAVGHGGGAFGMGDDEGGDR